MKTRVAVLLACAIAVPLAFARASSPVAAQTPPASAVTSADVDRLREYQTLLAARIGDTASVSVATLLKTTMSLAFLRSVGGAGADENRAAFMTLMFYVNRWPLEALVPESREWPRVPRRVFTLRARPDLAQHFISSAAIAASAGAPMAEWAGVLKEISDARGGSGFSFSDLAADRAGTAFGRLATRDHDAARRVQTFITERLVEDDFMPRVADLADNMSEVEFTRRFGGVGSPKYNEVVSDIDARIAALAIYK
jgi:hypothetical protein